MQEGGRGGAGEWGKDRPENGRPIDSHDTAQGSAGNRRLSATRAANKQGRHLPGTLHEGSWRILRILLFLLPWQPLRLPFSGLQEQGLDAKLLCSTAQGLGPRGHSQAPSALHPRIDKGPAARATGGAVLAASSTSRKDHTAMILAVGTVTTA
jgi:hypothetical protein